MNVDYTVLMLMHLSGDSLQVLAACLLSSLFSIAIPAKYKVIENTTYSYSYYALTDETILLLVISVIILVGYIGCFHG